MLKHGVATREEIETGHALAPVAQTPQPVTAAMLANMVRCGSPYDRPARAPTKFKVGDKVRARNMHPKTHTRLPRYVRGHVGGGAHRRLPRVSRQQGDRRPRGPALALHVRFDGRELWGADSDPTIRVAVEAWEPYLEAV